MMLPKFPVCAFCNKKSEGEDLWMRAIGDAAICSKCGGDLFNALRVVEDQKRKLYESNLIRSINLAKTYCAPGSVMHDALMHVEAKARAQL